MATAANNPLFSKYEETVQEANNFSIGENGMVQFNEGGLTSSADQIKQAQAALSALSVALVRGNSTGNPKKGKRGIKKANVPTAREIAGVERRSILRLVTSARTACEQIPDETARADYLQRLIVLAFNLRDIRGTFGKGERTLFCRLFIELWKQYPETEEVLVHEVPNWALGLILTSFMS